MDFEGNGAVAAAVQAEDEGSGGAADAGGSPSGPEDLGFASVLEGQGGPGSPCGPSGSGGPEKQSGPCSPNGQGDPGPNNQGGPGVLGGPGVEETAGSAAVDAPSVTQAARASGPGGDAAAVAVGPGNPQTVFTLTLPFQSYLEAELARLAMDTDAQRHWQGVEKEVIVTDNVLAVRWIAEDPDLLRVSINSFLEQLSVVGRPISSVG
uniref:L antigen family member 3 n=1 Tax=Rhinolophus ferrumequinum TaxID=59479 RepID=A0A671DTH4_RHIFE